MAVRGRLKGLVRLYFLVSIQNVLGPLDEMNTITGFAISPFVGWLARDVEITPNAAEVARAFAAPLRAFLAPPSGVLPWRGWTVDGELVWGATAAILRDFAAIVGDLTG